MVQQPVPYLVLSMSLTILSSLPGLKIGILAISNDRHALDKMDRRVKSRFYFDSVEFKPYSAKDIVEIFNRRLDFCLVSDCITREEIELIAQLVEGSSSLWLRCGFFGKVPWIKGLVSSLLSCRFQSGRMPP